MSLNSSFLEIPPSRMPKSSKEDWLPFPGWLRTTENSMDTGKQNVTEFVFYFSSVKC